MSDSEIFLADIDHRSDHGIRVEVIGPQHVCLEIVQKKEGSGFESKGEQVIVSFSGLTRALQALEQDKIVREAEREWLTFDYDWSTLVKKDQQLVAKSGLRSSKPPFSPDET